MITADTITDEQIRELRNEAWQVCDGGDEQDVFTADAVITACSLALAKSPDAIMASTVQEARARCAEILNARKIGGAL